MKQLALRILRRTPFFPLVALVRSSPLAEDGWLRSVRTHRAADRNGRPLPWMTYPLIDLLAARVPSDASIFEYGAGSSTLWWAPRVASVRAVEHDAAWRDALAPKLPANATIDLVSPAEYCESVRGGRYDVIVVDGEERERCLTYAVDALSDRGVIILDDTEGTRWPDGKQFMESRGFRRLDFSGMRPIHILRSSTSVFYRDNNCLGI